MPTTPIQALPYPGGADAPAGPTQIKALAEAVENRVVMRFASIAERDAKLPAGQRVAGMIAWVDANQAYYVWSTRGTPSWRILWQDTGWVNCTINGSGWTNVPGEQVQIRRIGMTVYMRGSAHNSTLAPGTAGTMGNVPAEFHPSQRAAFGASLNTPANLFVRIETNGNITAGWYGTGTATGSWWGFNNVVYTID